MFGADANFSSYRALDDLSFSVPRGQLLGVLGRNGAGKSTLLRVAGGIYSPDSGSVETRTTPTALIEMGLYGNQHLTGRKFCQVYLDFRNVKKSRQKQLLDDIHEFSELDEYFDEPINTYSAGMKARLMFGAITAVPAEIVLLDEILSVGDQHFQGKSYRRLISMVSKGASGILATHDWFTATRLCSNIMILNKGQVEFSGDSLTAVRQYLQLAPELSHKVIFCNKKALADTPLEIIAGKPFYLDFNAESSIDEPFAIGIAVEIPSIAMVVLLSNNHICAGGKGQHSIQIQMPAFPVGQRECMLSLFIYEPRRPGEAGTRQGHDQISWTSGDSIRLVNTAWIPEATGVIHRKLNWRRIG